MAFSTLAPLGTSLTSEPMEAWWGRGTGKLLRLQGAEVAGKERHERLVRFIGGGELEPDDGSRALLIAGLAGGGRCGSRGYRWSAPGYRRRCSIGSGTLGMRTKFSISRRDL